MKIAFWHFHTFRFLRGIETLNISLANALVKKNMDVSLITAAYPQNSLVKPDPKIKVHAYPVSRYFKELAIVPFYIGHFLKHRYDRIVIFFGDFEPTAPCSAIEPEHVSSGLNITGEPTRPCGNSCG